MLAHLALLFLVGSCSKEPAGPGKNPPVISEMTPSKRSVHLRETIGVKAVFSDVDGDTLTTLWTATAGFFDTATGDSVTWTAPDTAMSVVLSLKVQDGKGGKAEKSVSIEVGNVPPVISSLKASPASVVVNGELAVVAKASDPDRDQISYAWLSVNGLFIGSTIGDSVRWVAPPFPGPEQIVVVVKDSKGGEARDTVTVDVYAELGTLWVADSANRKVVKLAGDGRRLAWVGGFGMPVAVAVNLDDGSCWVADQERDVVVKLSSSGEVLVTVEGFSLPRSVAVYPSDGSCWVADSDSNRVVRLARDGSQLSLIRGLNLPQGVAVDRSSGDCWVADTNNNRVLRLSEATPSLYTLTAMPKDTTFLTIFRGIKSPIALDVDATTGDCWVATADSVVRIRASDGSRTGVGGFSRPLGLSVDPVTGKCWIADTGNNRVIRLGRDIHTGDVIDQGGRLPRSPGAPFSRQNVLLASCGIAAVPFSRPAAVAAGPTGTCWVTDTYNDRLVKLSANEPEQEVDFALLDGCPIVMTGFNLPRSVTVNPGR